MSFPCPWTCAYFLSGLREALGEHAHVGEVRGEGLMAAVEFVKDRDTRRLFDPKETIGAKVAGALLKRGIIGRAMPQGDILGFAPPFCMTRAEADSVVAATKDSVAEILG